MSFLRKFAGHGIGSIQGKVACEGTRKLFFNLSGYNKYGLLYHDIIHITPEVEEAVRRLPPTIRDKRMYRIVRAQQLSIEHSILPKEQWTKYEDDVRYLTPYLDEVMGEKKERDMWNKAH